MLLSEISVSRLTLQFESDRNSQQSLRRKSIYVKDVRLISIIRNNKTNINLLLHKLLFKCRFLIAID